MSALSSTATRQNKWGIKRVVCTNTFIYLGKHLCEKVTCVFLNACTSQLPYLVLSSQPFQLLGHPRTQHPEPFCPPPGSIPMNTARAGATARRLNGRHYYNNNREIHYTASGAKLDRSEEFSGKSCRQKQNTKPLG
jgi:hypothetical protein